MPNLYNKELHYRKRPFLHKNGSFHHVIRLDFRIQGYVIVEEQFMRVT